MGTQADFQCWQSMYGKLVAEKDGAIVHREEYSCTGHSEDLPAEVASQCEPPITGIGNSAFTNWYQYPWGHQQRPPRGGVIFRSFIDSEDRPFLIAGRLCPRPENPSQQNSRQYIMAHYLVAPIREIFGQRGGRKSQAGEGDIPDLALFELLRLLKPEPMTAPDEDMERVPVTAPHDREFSKTWAATVEMLRAYLEPLLCGKSVCVEDEKVTPDKFLGEIGLVCLCCLPRAVRWRLTVGAGFCKMNGDVALAHGQSAQGEVCCINGKWERKGQLPNEILTKAKRYVKWLARACAEDQPGKPAKSLRDVTRWIDKGIPTLAQWDTPAIPKGASWQQAVATNLDHFTEAEDYEVFGNWLDGTSSAPPREVNDFKLFRTAVLQQVLLSALQGKNGRLLLRQVLGEAWWPDWEQILAREYNQDFRASAIYLGVIPFDIEHLLKSRLPSFPSETDTLIAEVFLNALKESFDKQTARQWGRLISKVVNENPHWLQELCHTESFLFWKSCEAHLIYPTEGLLECWRDKKQVILDLLNNNALDPHAIFQFLEIIPSENLVLAAPMLHALWERKQYAEALLLHGYFERMKVEVSLNNNLSFDALVQRRDRAAIAESAARFLHRVDRTHNSERLDPLFHLVIPLLSELPKELRDPNALKVPKQLQRELNGIVFESERATTPATFTSAARELIKKAIQVNDEVIWRVSICCHAEHKELTALLRTWLEQGLKHGKPSRTRFPFLAFAAEVLLKTIRQLPKLGDILEAGNYGS